MRADTGGYNSGTYTSSISLVAMVDNVIDDDDDDDAAVDDKKRI
jgi:hypothetical protein